MHRGDGSAFEGQAGALLPPAVVAVTFWVK